MAETIKPKAPEVVADAPVVDEPSPIVTEDAPVVVAEVVADIVAGYDYETGAFIS